MQSTGPSTKPVSFRVPTRQYDQLEATRHKTGLSYTDLLNKGAGLVEEEVNEKLERMRGSRRSLVELDTQVRERRQELDRDMSKEKERRGLVWEVADRRHELEEVQSQVAKARGELKALQSRVQAVRKERDNVVAQTQKLHKQSHQGGTLDPMFMLLALMMLGSVVQQPQQQTGGEQSG